jgi:hypothetical protein
MVRLQEVKAAEAAPLLKKYMEPFFEILPG